MKDDEEAGDDGGTGRRLRNQVGRDQLDRLPLHPGLCAGCTHLILLASRRSVFVRCGLAARDPAFVRYPPLPVHICSGYLESPHPSR